MTRYYRLKDDVYLRGRWFLHSPLLPSGEPLDPRVFLRAQPLDLPIPLRLPLRRRGRALDFTLADFSMPVASKALAERLDHLAPGAIQRFPVEIEGQQAQYEVLNLQRSVRCLDERASKIEWWAPEDGRPDKVGQYRMILEEVINPSLAGAAPIFRLGGWLVEIVCTDLITRGAPADEFAGLAYDVLAISAPAT